MHVVIAVTVCAAAFRLAETIAGMTGTTSNGRVQPDQGKSCQIVVEPSHLSPCLLRMTLQTVVGKLASVRVVYGMARTTTIGYRAHRRCFVTGGTIQFRVRVDQGESRAIVIEGRIRPEERSMTVVALLTVSTLMLVFAAVAVDAAIFEHVFEVLSTMAVITLQSGVRIFQWKICFGMIESNAAPRRSRVAVLTSAAVRTGMYVIDCVTTCAARWSLGKQIVSVTVTTGHKTVISRQSIVR